MRHQLHDNRRRNVGHDPKRKDRKPLQRAPGKHVEHAEDATLVAVEKLSERRRINAGNRDVRSNAVDDQGAEKKHQPTLQIAVLSAFTNLSRISCQETPPFSCYSATLPPAASIAALAPLVAPTPLQSPCD